MFCVFRILFCWIAIEAFYGSTVTGYRWVPLKAGDKIPRGTFYLTEDTYIGRARHYDEILPAKVHNNSYAEIYSCSKIIRKLEYDVLVGSTSSCKFTPLTDFSDLSENAVRVGTMQNGEPSYLIVTIGPEERFIGSILLASRKVLRWKNLDYDSHFNNVFGLECSDDEKWVDTSSENIPENSVYGGKSESGHDMYVGRLKFDCDIAPGQVIPTLGIATAVLNGQDIKSLYCEMLVGDTKNYTWVSAQYGEIPENSVAAATSKQNELMYVGRVNKTLTYIVHSEALQNQMAYEILVRGEKQPEHEITIQDDEHQEHEITEGDDY